jgi:acetyl-CoA C-acetyltransferase
MFAAQGHLGAMPATVVDGLWDTPSSRHEAACASGSIAALAAITDLRSGAYETALVVGVELEKTVPGDTAARHLGAAAWTGREGQDAKFMWPYMFSRVADEYDRRYGIDESHLRAIATVNFANARRNPNAQTRDWTLPDLIAGDSLEDEFNPIVEGRIRRFDCSQMTDGGSGVVLVTDNYLRDHPDAKPLARIEGWGHRTVGLGMQQKLERSAEDPYVMPHVRRTVMDAFDRARVTLDDLDGIEVHDCFTPSEYLAIDHIGLTGPGESWKAIENGEIELGGRLPINPSGGLIGGGHPVGASGVRMLFDAAKQVSGTAGAYQVEGAGTFGTLNFGGSTATTVSFVVRGQGVTQ